MTVVNNILNMVDLNTKKYNDNLKKMTKTTTTETKKSSAAFSGLSAAWKSMIGVISAGAIGNAVVKELKSTESAVASFIDSTGSIDKARETFEMLQQSARDTLQPFDSLKAAALDLRRNGIEPTSKQLTTFSQIAISSGKSLETVTSAFTSSVQGKFRALAQLGIVAKETGDKIALTYKGTTTVIEKSNAALTDYFTKIGDQNRGALDYLQRGMTGALNHFENAWGDFIRAISESGLGQAIADTIREVSKVLDGITGWINRNQKSIQSFFSGWSFYVKQLGNDFDGLRQDMENWLTTADKVKKTSGEDDDVGIFGWIKSATETVGEKYFELFNGSDAERAYKAEKERLKALFDQRVANMKKGSNEYTKEVEKFNQSIVDLERKFSDKQTTVFGRILNFYNLEDTAQKMHDNLEKTSEELKKFKAENENLEIPRDVFPAGPGDSGSGETGSGSTGGRLIDNWSKYYKSILDIHKSNLSARERLEIEFNDKMSELAAEAGNSQSATAAEIANAKLIIEQDYATKVEELRRNAYSYYLEQIGAEDLQLQESYDKRLSDLEEYYNQRLMTDEQYLEARQAIFDEYYEKQSDLRNSQRKSEGIANKQQIEDMRMMADSFGSLSDAFSNLTNGMSNASSAYKAMFAVEKAFAVASATMNAILAWSQALSDPTQVSWIAKLAQYANAIALTANIVGQLKSVTMHDNGGRIPEGQIGIVGEFGPEIVTGPANVTSRKATADLARSAINGNGTNVQVNLYEDASRAGTVEQRQESDGENIIDIFVSNIRRGGQVAQTLESTYMLHRYGS